MAKGRKITIQYVHQPLDKECPLDPEDGRIVPAYVVAATHLNAQQAFFELLTHYKNHPD